MITEEKFLSFLEIKKATSIIVGGKVASFCLSDFRSFDSSEKTPIEDVLKSEKCSYSVGKIKTEGLEVSVLHDPDLNWDDDSVLIFSNDSVDCFQLESIEECVFFSALSFKFYNDY